MKRVWVPARRCFIVPAVMLTCVWRLYGDCPQSAGREILAWVAAVRGEAGCAVLATDPVLDLAAAEYAAELAGRGVLSHRGRDGRNALDRVQAAGGTSTLVGEILGSGTGPGEVCSAWSASAGHRSVVESPLWTHVGAGCAPRGGRQVWVVLFAVRRVAGLAIEAIPNEAAGNGYRVSGRLEAGEGVSPVLLSGLGLLEPEVWLPGSGRFVYLIPRGNETLYHRLGFEDAQGALTITDAFYPQAVATSSPETEPR